MITEFNETIDLLRSRGVSAPHFGIVLGTGLGKLVEHIDVIAEIPYEEIPHFPLSTVESHSGKLVFGRIGEKLVLAMAGRFHYYEGYTMQQITYPIRIMKMIGVKELLLSNACGTMNMEWKKGELMLIDDHISLLPDNPLFGKNQDFLGPRFPDMSRPYDPKINAKMKELAASLDIKLNEGVYVAVGGPNLETRAEYRFLKGIGADVVGMSTVPEVIVANHMGLPCAAISVLTDECDPDNLAPVNIADIIEVAGQAEVKLIQLLKAYIQN